MRIILKVWSSNSDYSDGSEYAAVEISQELAKLMLRRINVLSEQRALDPALCETCYWDYSPEYFNPWVNRASRSRFGSPVSSWRRYWRTLKLTHER